ncbi:conserved hypothetical protein [Histoplasma mississippiense (nom. inval.)]|uniref:conserved hypothetical protein n=1 Tax=Ajellomyces capsulatus (strain NAm1 / WU24) TaxID=2059318 RepID=UPI000157B322|nr:conserved hypothetical protein [Histoplasma mississippiense (nom. inval.)]EDN02216.1 conserved hypothetical protein [Histoplasma mississippiense (nom. inval.)]
MVSSPNAKRPAKSGNARTSKQLPLAPSQRARPNRPPFQSAPVQAAPPRTRSINPKGLTVCAVAAFCFSTYGTYLFHKTAPTYDANVELTERIMRIGKKREELVKRARGNVLEVACGTGRNMQYYSLGERRGTDKNGKAEILGCRSVTFVDQSPQMVEIAREKFEKMYPHFRRAAFWAQDAMAPIPPLEHTTVMQGSSQSSGSSSLGNSNNNKGNGNGSKSLQMRAQQQQQQSCTFDTVIQTMGLCSLPDPVSYLKHLGTLVEPERGEILLLEHGRSHYRWLNKLLDDLAAAHADRHGCWWNRDIGEIVRQSGLEIVESKRWHMGTTWRFILRRKEGAGRGEKDLGLAEVSEREENGDGAAKSVTGWLGWGAKKS